MKIPTRLVTEASRLAGRYGAAVFAGRVHNPMFIVGCGRSGTTLLNHLFDLHPEVANYPSEANELWHPRLYPWNRATLTAPPFWVDPTAFTRTSLAARTAEDDRRLLGTFGAFQTAARQPVFLNKTVMVTFMLDKVLELFPTARFIHLYRDGRAVALSHLVKEKAKVDGPRYHAQGYVYDDETRLAMYAQHWRDHVLAVGDADRRHDLTRRGRLFELSYEDLCRDPRTGLEGLARFMGVAPAPFVEADLGECCNTNGKAQKGLSSEKLARLNEIAGEALRAKGYGAAIA